MVSQYYHSFCAFYANNLPQAWLSHIESGYRLEFVDRSPEQHIEHEVRNKSIEIKFFVDNCIS